MTARHACPIRGHDHDLTVVREHRNPEGRVGHTVECPSGRYRWFVLEGRTVSNLTRQNRPRWGWTN